MTEPNTNPISDQALHDAREALNAASSIVVLTGSGVSAESTIPTFREARDALQAEDDTDPSMKALWAEFDPQTLATPQAYAKDPEMVTRWYDWRRLRCLDAEPNPGHLALAEIQRRAEAEGHRFTLLTQNVDGLHQRAGSSRVIELHGSIMKWRCINSKATADPPEGPFDEYPPHHPYTGAPLRPCVVWFGESLPHDAIEAADQALTACDLFMSIGTSSVVYPAAGFIHTAKAAGATTIEINPEDTPISPEIDIALRGKSGEVLPLLLDRADPNAESLS